MIKNTRKKLLTDTFTLFRTDEVLLRLLYHAPLSDPLSDKHEDILSLPSHEMWDIVDHHIISHSKSSEIVSGRICRIYVYLGKTRPSYRNKFTTKQEIVVDVFCHIDYGRDIRMESIADRLSQLMFRSRIKGGLGRVDYRNGYEFQAPRDYEAFRHIFEVGNSK